MKIKYKQNIALYSFTIGLFIIIQLALSFYFGVFHGRLTGPDSYMHLNRAVHLYDSGEWYGRSCPRINPPIGHEQHWTRPFDLLLIVGLIVGEVFSEPKAALYLWGTILSPLLGVLTLFVIIRAFNPITKDKVESFLFLFPCQFGLILSFCSGRPDHQSLLLLLFTLSLGISIQIQRKPFSSYWCTILAIIHGLAIWVSVEALLFVVMTTIFWGIYWIKGNRETLKKFLWYSGSLATFVILAVLVELGPSRFYEPIYDQVSIVISFIFTFIFIFWLLVYIEFRIFGLGRTPLFRLTFSIVGVFILVIMVNVLFPGFLFGLKANVDDLYRNTRLIHILEYLPLIPPGSLTAENWTATIGITLLKIGIWIWGVPTILWLLFQKSTKDSTVWYFIGLNLLLYLPIAVQQIHYLPYTQILFLIPVAWLLSRWLNKINTRSKGITSSLGRILAIWACCISTVLVSFVFLAAAPAGTRITPKVANVDPLIRFLNDPNGIGRKSQNILAFVDYGPEILFRTAHSVYAIPNHRYQSGYNNGYNLLTSKNFLKAERLARKMNIDVIIIGLADSVEDSFYHIRDKGELLFDFLAAGDQPDWLNEITLPSDVDSSFKAFVVNTRQSYNLE